MKNYSDNPVENALLNDADQPINPFKQGDPGKYLQTLVPTEEWKSFSQMSQSKRITISLMLRIAMRQHLVWLRHYRSPCEIKLNDKDNQNDDKTVSSDKNPEDWFRRNADRRNPKAFIHTNPEYFASECASAILNGTLIVSS